MNELAGLTVNFDTSSVNPATRDVDAFNKTAQRTDSVIRAIEAAARRSGVSFQEAARRYDAATESLRKKSSAASKAANDNEKLANTMRVGMGVAESFAGRLGVVGDLLRGLGPIGIGAAAGIGALGVALGAAAVAALDLADKAGKLKDFSDTTGFTVTQLQALQKAGAQVGVSAESVSRGLERFSVQMDDIKKGLGPVYEQILEINPALAKQMTQAKSAAEAWDVFARAIKQADLENANKLARAAFGRGGIELTRLMRASADAGGVESLAAAIKKVNLLTAEQADYWDNLGDKIAENMRQSKQNVTVLFAEPVLESLTTVTDGIRSLTERAASFKMSDELKLFFKSMVAAVPIIGPLANMIGGAAQIARSTNQANGISAESFDQRFGGLPTSAPPTIDAAKQAAALEKEKAALNQTIAARERYAAVAGAAVTPLQQLQLQIDKIVLAEKENKISAEDSAKAQKELNRQFNSTQFAAYVGLLGETATVAERVRVKENEIADARARGIAITKTQRENLLRLTREQALGITQMQSQIDAYRVEAETVGMGTEQAVAYAAAQNLINERIRAGQPYREDEIAQIREKAAVLGQAAAAAERARQVDQLGRDFFSNLAMNMKSAKTVGEALNKTFESMLDTLTQIGSKEIWNALRSGNLFGSQSAAGSATGSLRSEVSDGIQIGWENISRNAQAQRGFSFNGPGMGNAAVGGLMAVGAGMGIYSNARSQGRGGASVGTSALSGFISGGLSGAAIGSMVLPGIGTAIGAAVGAIGGGLLGFFGGRSGERQRAEDNRRAWDDARAAAFQFGDQIAGRSNGSLTSTFRQAFSQMQEFVRTAADAEDWASIRRIQGNFVEMVARTQLIFNNSFEGMLDALNSGLGENSPFASAAQNVRDVGEAMRSFIDDTRTSFAVNIGAYADGSAAERIGGAAEIARAQQAAQNYLLSLLDAVPALTATQEALGHLSGTAAQLQSALVDVGMSAEAAARAISDRVGSALRRIADTFVGGLQRQINDAMGRGFINQIADLVAQRTANLADAAALGLSRDLVDQWFQVSAQRIVDDAGLAGDALAALVAQFPDLAGAVSDASSAVEDLTRSAEELARGRESLADRLLRATTDTSTLEGQLLVLDRQFLREREEEQRRNGELLNDLIAAQEAERLAVIRDYNQKIIDEQKSAAEEIMTFWSGITRDWHRLADSIRGGSSSTLDPRTIYSNALSQYNAQKALVSGGDREAASSFTQYVNDLREAARKLFGSTSSYQAIEQMILSDLETIPGQVSDAQYIVNAINEMKTAVVAAFGTGNLSTIAATLITYLPRIDTNSDGAISYQEMVSALGGTATPYTQQIFDTLDIDGDRIVSAQELTRAATQGTTTAINTTTNAVDAVKAQLELLNGTRQNTANIDAQTNAIKLNTANMDSTLNGMNTQLQLVNSWLGGSIYPALDNIKANTFNAYSTLDNRIIRALNVQSANWGASGNGSTSLPTFATGGRIWGPGTTTSDSILLRGSRDEYMIRAASARSIGYDNLDRMNQTGRVPVIGVSARDNEELRDVMLDALEELIHIRSNTGNTTRAVARGSIETNKRLDKMSSASEEMTRRAMR